MTKFAKLHEIWKAAKLHKNTVNFHKKRAENAKWYENWPTPAKWKENEAKFAKLRETKKKAAKYW